MEVVVEGLIARQLLLLLLILLQRMVHDHTVARMVCGT